ncbi:SixA phosphatase family protein [Urechidicola croceus]|uniref:Phosphoglycerate mutase n=1 Tax=Urechidicola croceus TaxID=1850246 RepID=A0A1D8P5M2_9FLAO|nr:phosphoglycerate mutase family protein [Urechidicola croceus]AOW19863.1 hypothetical protein LPB138_03810 [Urechidicola croceus]
MKYSFLILIFSFSLNSIFSQETSQNNTKSTTTYYLIRHSEKDLSNPTNSNPDISEKGQERAEKWAELFQNINFDAIYSTDYNRTKQTAEPTSIHNELTTIIYDLKNFDFDKFKTETKNKTVLIVGHSNTIPVFANKFINEEIYEQIEEKNYSNLYIINISNNKISHNLFKID